MSAVVFGSVVAIVLAAFAGGYVWGWFNGSASAQHPDGPETCRAKLRAAETVARMWRARAGQVEEENADLKRAMAEFEHGETVTVGWLLEQLDQATAPVALPATGTVN